MRRPLVWISAALICGAASASVFRPPLFFFLTAFLLSWTLTVLLILLRKRKTAAATIVVTTFFLGVSSYLLQSYVLAIPDQLSRCHTSDAPVTATLTGTAIECLPAADGDRLTFVLDVEHVGIKGANVDVRANGRTRVNWYQPGARVEPGDIVKVSGSFKRLRGFKNPGTFDYERYMHRRGIFTTMYARGPAAVSFEGKAELAWPRRFREYFRSEGLRIISSATLTGETRAFVSAILLGERSLLTEKMEDWFRQTGTFHVLAISGLHVGLIYLIVSLALGSLPLGSRTRVAISILVVWIFAFATGGSVSVTRATIMLTLVLTGYYLSREGDFLTSVAVAALLIVGPNPVVVDELGFQLSFTAVVLLCTFEPLFSEKVYPVIQENLHWIPAPVLHRLAITLYASLVIGIGMLPLVAYHFNIVSFVFPIANLIVVPLLSLVLASAFGCLLSGVLWLKSALVFGLIAEAFSWAIFTTVKICSLIPGSSMRVSSPPIWMLGLEALVVTLMWWRIRPARKMMLFAMSVLLVAAISLGGKVLDESKIRATFLDVGDSDSCFLEFPDGKTMLVDCGFAAAYLDCGQRLIAPFLWKKGIQRIDTLVLTHTDSDHTGGSLFLIENFRVGRLLLADFIETEKFSQVLREVAARGCPVEKMCAGDVLTGCEQVRVEALHPPSGSLQERLSDNDGSLVLRVTYGKTSLLLTGDVQRKAFRLMLDSSGEFRSQVLKAPHHGLRSGFSREFVTLVQPELVVISGRAHRRRQNMEERKKRYLPVCKTVLSTSDCGAIIVEMDGHEIRTGATRKAQTTPF